MKFKLVEDFQDERTKKAINAYRDFANLKDEDKIEEGKIDDWALNEAACKYNYRPELLKEELLKEETTIDQAAKDLEAEQVAATNENQITKALDKALKKAKRMKGATEDFPNILLIGEAGTGKTSIVRQWARDNGINLVQKNLGTMGPEAFGGIIARDADDPRYATRLGTNEMIKALEKPNSVLFLDEYNRAKTEVRGAVLTLVQNHMVWDPTEESQEKYLDNFLFTVAAINPPNGAYKGAKELDPAEMSRFYSMTIQMDPGEQLDYLRKFYKDKIKNAVDDEDRLENEGRLKLAETILKDKDFYYDTSEEVQDNFDNSSYKPLNYRSFKMALDFSDGTKEDFLDIWNHYCNYKKKSTIENILSDYVDVEDKANDAIKDGSESDVFAKSKTNAEKLKSKFPGLNI